jgi:hypothetical protein
MLLVSAATIRALSVSIIGGPGHHCDARRSPLLPRKLVARPRLLKRSEIALTMPIGLPRSYCP